jgi:hypothetical protein
VGEQLEGAAPLLQVLGDGRHHQPPPRPRAAAPTWTPSLQGYAAMWLPYTAPTAAPSALWVEPGGALVGDPTGVKAGGKLLEEAWRDPALTTLAAELHTEGRA